MVGIEKFFDQKVISQNHPFVITRNNHIFGSSIIYTDTKSQSYFACNWRYNLPDALLIVATTKKQQSEIWMRNILENLTFSYKNPESGKN